MLLLFNGPSPALGLPRTWLFRRDLQRLQRGKGVVLGIGGFNQWFKDRFGFTRIWIDSEIQRVGGEPAEIDDAVLDRLRWIGRLRRALFGLVDKISQLRNL